MFSNRSFVLLTTALSAILSPVAQAAPAPQQSAAAASSSYWYANMDHSRATVWGNSNGTNYKVWRPLENVKTDGSQDVSSAIQDLLEDGGRCGADCNSTTITPAIIYIPGGTYLLEKPLNLTYYTQIIGDPTDRPVFKPGSAPFPGMAMFDANPYANPNNTNWFINQNNFFRQIRNIVIDMRGSANTTTGIHWQVAQATSLQNIDFLMDENSGQQGIFMDNGSGGFCSDLYFEGGMHGMFVGSQQFTSRNMTFKNCGTAIYMNWNWGWTFSGVNITGSGDQTGLDMSANPSNQSVGSVVFSDSSINGLTYGVKTSYGGNGTGGNVPATGGTLILDNVDFTGTTNAIWQVPLDKQILAGGKVIKAWSQGNSYTGSSAKQTSSGDIKGVPTKPDSLLQGGKVFGLSKPQYAGVPASSFKSVKGDGGCAGDGEKDDTKCVQDFLNNVCSNSHAYFDHGAYLIKDTITIPQKCKIVGEIWPLIVADGKSFSDASNPKPVIQVGKPGTQGGAVEIQDMIFETKGAAPGAIMIQWNMKSAPGESGMWDSHVRIGGSAGTELLKEQCPGIPTVDATTKSECEGVFLMFHATKSSGGFVLENDWFWVADHDLEDSRNQTQISIYSARGALFQNSGPVWLWGTASEHSAIYNYQIDSVGSFFGGFMQTETPYWAPFPLMDGKAPFKFNAAYDDPTFAICTNGSAEVPCKEAWGLRVTNSKNVFIYSTGMYNFFNSYNQKCVWEQNCQENMIRIQNSQVYMYAVTTKASVNMLQVDDHVTIPAAENRDIYGDTLAYYFSGQ